MISIVIPCWGEYWQYLSDCLESIEKQTYKDFEVIIVGTETDLPTARNKGIEKAKGEWILPMDADDRLREDYLEKTIGKGDIVTTACFNDNESYYLAGKDITIDKLMWGNHIIACSLFKKEVWDKIGGYDENMKLGWEDWEFWIRAVKAGYQVTVIEEALYEYRKRPNSMVNTYNESIAREYINKKHL
jgi:glycosyltransferase involved in cell wall biosynthesis